MLRVHTAGSVGCSTANVATDAVQGGRFQRVLAVAWEKQAEGNAQWGLGWRQVRQHGRGRHLRPVGARVHQPLGRARAHRLEGRGEGPPQRGQEPVRAPEAPRHHHREGARLDDAVGPDPLPRVVPVVRRRVRDRRRRPRHGQRSTRRRRGCSAPRCAPSSDSSPGATRCARRRGSTAAPRVYRDAGITNPAQQIDVAELYVPFSWYEPMWLEGHDLADPGEGWKMTDDGAHRDDRLVPGEPVGRGALEQPDRRVGHDPLRRGGAAGAGQGRRAPGRGRARSRSAHAYGAMAQYFAMAVLSSSPSPL